MPRRKAIALLTCNASLGDDYQGALRLGVEQACRGRDIDLWVYAGRTSWDPSGDQSQVFGLLGGGRIDGIVFATGLISSYTSVEDVLSDVRDCCRVPCCAVGQRRGDMPSIVVDNRRGVMASVEHLVTHHGRRHFVFIAGPPGHEESEVRIEAARQALSRHGIRLGGDDVVHADFGVTGGRTALEALLERGRPLDAVMCANDHMALGGIDALAAAGRRCPDEVAVVGFDDSAIARFSTPSLTTVRQPTCASGRLAVERIVQAWDGKAVEHLTVLGTDLVARESCGCQREYLRFGEDASHEDIDASLEQALSMLAPERQRAARWSRELQTAVRSELAGDVGALARTLQSILRAIDDPAAPLYQLHQVISVLKGSVSPERRAEVDRAFDTAHVTIGDRRHRDVGKAKLRGDQLTEQLKASCERLSRSLSLDVLTNALAVELPQLGIHRGYVATYAPCDPTKLCPLLSFCGSDVIRVPNAPYPARSLVPDGAWRPSKRYSVTVMALTCEFERLGVAILELPLGTDAHSVLREQISASIKAARLHEEVLARERLSARIQEEQRITQERLRSLNLIAGSVAHDLNNALGPLVALPETMRQELEGGAPASPEILDDLESIRLARASRRPYHSGSLRSRSARAGTQDPL